MNNRSPRNRTLRLSDAERAALAAEVVRPAAGMDVVDRIICGTAEDCVSYLPGGFADLLILDPPYNLNKDFNGWRFREMDDGAYEAWLESWFPALLEKLKPQASIYFCCDWRNSAAVFRLLDRHCRIRNRIVWQREKGRGASANWKNSCEDIWFATVGTRYRFNLDAVKLRKKVIAPYRAADGTPKDWTEDASGENYRLTCPGNFWDDITVPYWSMPENTDHPTQKPEKLLARLILASSDPGDIVLDPFLGSGTTAVAAKKLGRHYCGIEMNPEYCLWAAARLKRAEDDKTIQGYSGGVFTGRNDPRGKGTES